MTQDIALCLIGSHSWTELGDLPKVISGTLFPSSLSLQSPQGANPICMVPARSQLLPSSCKMEHRRPLRAINFLPGKHNLPVASSLPLFRSASLVNLALYSHKETEILCWLSLEQRKRTEGGDRQQSSVFQFSLLIPFLWKHFQLGFPGLKC